MKFVVWLIVSILVFSSDPVLAEDAEGFDLEAYLQQMIQEYNDTGRLDSSSTPIVEAISSTNPLEDGEHYVVFIDGGRWLMIEGEEVGQLLTFCRVEN